MKYGILSPRRVRRKPRVLLESLHAAAEAASIDTGLFDTYQPCETLVLYGWGGQVQQQAIAKHDGHYVAFDLGYWARDGFARRHWRVSINGFHSPELIMRGPRPDAGRFLGARIPVRPQRRHDGPILLIGNAPKSLSVLKLGGWTAKRATEIRQAFPGKKVLYRGKPGRPVERDVRHDGMATGFIDDEIQRASLVVCRHSNVAVDACRLGVPVVCEDGAAAAIYPSRLEDWQNQPSLDERREFLERLAWWQWSISEIRAGRFWPWLEQRLAEL